MNNQFEIGQRVYWKWMGSRIYGTVEELFERPIVKVIKGKRIKRNGSGENPAVFVKSEAGNFALKLSSELKDSFGLEDR